MRRPLTFFVLPTTLLLSSLGCDENNVTADASVIEPDAFVPPPSPTIVTFAATHDAVPRGDTVTLNWKVENAEIITIYSQTEILKTTTDLEGSVTTLPIRADATFEIHAAGYGIVDKSVDVGAIWPDVVINEASVEPDTTIVNGTTTVRWVTQNAEKVSIFANGALVFEPTFMGSRALMGSTVIFPMQEGDITVQVKAENPTHTVTQDLILTVAPFPAITSFRTEPRTFIGTSTTVTLTWESEGTQYTDLLQDYVPVPGFSRATSGSMEIELTGPALFILQGYFMDQVYTSFPARVGVAALEFEPNDQPRQGLPITNEGGAQGTLSDENDVDYYAIDIFPTFSFGNDIRIWTRGAEGCTTDTKIELLNAAMQVLGTDEDDGIPTGRGGGCSSIEPERDVFATNLFGTFYIGVRSERGESGDYILMTEVIEKPLPR